jgi:hypothetical protein
MSNKRYKISIDKPCTQQWENMTPDKTDRFCNSCKKNVVDFTQYSDFDLIQFLKNNYGKNICGRIETARINTLTISIDKSIFYTNATPFQHLFAAFILTFGFSLFNVHFVFGQVNENASGIELNGIYQDTLNPTENAVDKFDSTQITVDTAIIKKHDKKKTKQLYAFSTELIMSGRMTITEIHAETKLEQTKFSHFLPVTIKPSIISKYILKVDPFFDKRSPVKKDFEKRMNFEMILNNKRKIK